MASSNKLEFGLKHDVPDASAIWGARAIFSRGRIDLLHDRADLVYASPEAKESLVNKLKGGATQKFVKWVEKKAFFDQTRDIQTVSFDGVKFYASTNASHGYLYISAMEDSNG